MFDLCLLLLCNLEFEGNPKITVQTMHIHFNENKFLSFFLNENNTIQFMDLKNT